MRLSRAKFETAIAPDACVPGMDVLAKITITKTTTSR